ncbi:unnamed protein product, partial [Brenthis ino]
MSDVSNIETTPASEKPVKENDDVQFPPFPEPGDDDFEDDIPEEERNYYKNKFKDLNTVTSLRLHCSACDRHLGCSARNDAKMRPHPMLRTLVCHTCHTFYNSGEFEKGDDGSELYCRWCGQGGQVYCCSDCPHVFCAKCVKRNLGNPKIKEIEEADDWKCFKCNNRCLWDLRATCWAVLRYCDLKSKITFVTQDPILKEAYQKHCAIDHSECCRNKFRRKEIKKKELEPAPKKGLTDSIISKIPPTIQVKKFASISMEESPKLEKKAQKRPASPKNKAIFIKNPIAISTKGVNHMGIPTLPKKVRMPNSAVINPVRFNNDRKMQQNFNTYTRIRPKAAGTPMSIMFNGFNNAATYNNDNINLSLESLTQGLDISAVAAMAGGSSLDDDVVCTPDFPLEPLCEVTEDNGDDDVQCMTPGPVVAPKSSTPFLAIRATSTLPDLSPENIVQMTDNDVTVNANTGGLKFRVDPQTLSSNKMYRLPDGRIFAINANPNMPGGYSATIVAVTDNGAAKNAKGTTFAAKLSAVSAAPPPKSGQGGQGGSARRAPPKRPPPKSARPTRASDAARVCDLNVPVEWYRYNLIDAIDAMEYSLSRLHQLKKDTTSMHLRTRSLSEMRNLHKALERSLNTSVTRFKDIRDNLNKEFKQYVAKKSSDNVSDDDDVEILHEEDNDDPIFIDENSTESNMNDNQEVDLTAVGSSDHNESNERSLDKSDYLRNEGDACSDAESFLKQRNDPSDELLDQSKQMEVQNDHSESEITTVVNAKEKTVIKQDSIENDSETKQNGDRRVESPKTPLETDESSTKIVKEEKKADEIKEERLDDDILNENQADSDKKSQDSEMSEEMIENLLKDDNGEAALEG